MFRNCELKPILHKCRNSFVHLILYLDTLTVWWSLMEGYFLLSSKKQLFQAAEGLVVFFLNTVPYNTGTTLN